MSTKKKLGFRQLRLFYIRTVYIDKGTYKLEEIYSTKLAGIFLGNRLKPFIYREEIYVLNNRTYNAIRSLSTKQELENNSDSNSISPSLAKTQQQDSNQNMTNIEEDSISNDITSLQYKAWDRPTRNQCLQQIVERVEEIKR